MSLHIPRVLLATNNKNKLRELRAILGPMNIEVTTLPDPPEVEETGVTFAENAILKACEFAQISGLPALADDSGLAVDALDGAPGVYSARFAGAHGDTAANNALLLERLEALDAPSRSARFHCAIALVLPDAAQAQALRDAQLPAGASLASGVPAPMAGLVFEGQAEGEILHAPRGDGGFGYDPLFLSEDLGETFAEASPEAKHRVSHRRRAIDGLIRALEALR